MYLDAVFNFPDNSERLGYFLEFADNVGDALTFKILKSDLVTIFHRSVIRKTAHASHWNK
jgi:hypothetical protein